MNKKAWTAGIVLGALTVALIVHWLRVWQVSHAADVAGKRLVVFGPSGWDTFAPGMSEADVARITENLDRKFKLEHPEVSRIVHDARGPVGDGLARLRNAEVAGDPIDVIVCAANPVNTAYVRFGLIAPLDMLVKPISDRFTAGAVENFTVEGKVWGVPLSAVSLTTFFYNKTLFAKIGATPPRTYEDFVALGPKFRALGIIPVVHQGKNAWMWLLYYMSSLVQTSNNNQVAVVEGLLDGHGKFSDPVNLRALKLARRWVDDGLLDAQSNELDENNMKSVFYSGKAAAYFGGTWDLPGIAANATFEWGMFPFPKYTNEPGQVQAFGGVESGLCMAATTLQPELARAYIEFATRADNARELLAPLKPFATSHREVAGVNGEVAEALRAQLPAAKFLDWIFPPELTDAIQREIQAMMGLSQTPEQTAANIDAKFAALVKAGYRNPRVVSTADPTR